jgi:hypothetical protein
MQRPLVLTSALLNLAASARQQPQRVSEIDLLRDAVLALQGIDGHYTRFQDAPSGLERDKRGLPVHPLEQGNGAGRVEGQLLFVQPDNDVSLPIPFKYCCQLISCIL